jgi:septal ring factor EnvC (AmiA/AmiB activator)
MFGTDPVLRDLNSRITELTREVAALRGERQAARDDLAQLQDARELREEIETLKLEKGRLEEEHAREVREVRHMVGLEKMRGEFEREQATREARLEVREGAVDDKVQAFTERMEFVREQLTEQISYLKNDIISEVFKRLPVVEVNKTLEFSTDGGNGAASEG